MTQRIEELDWILGTLPSKHPGSCWGKYGHHWICPKWAEQGDITCVACKEYYETYQKKIAT